MKTFDDRKQCVQAYMAQIQKNRRKTAVMVTSLTLVASILALVLFLPYSTTPPSVEQYANSEYYDLIQKINIATYHKPKYKNNFQSLVAFCTEFGRKIEVGGDLMYSSMPDNMAPTQPNAAPGYVEVTDNQVAGVVESDIFKRTDKYVYYLRNKTLFVYSIAQEASELVASYTIRWADALNNVYNTEMYLSNDGSMITFLAQGYNKTMGALTLVMNLDVSDPNHIAERSRVYFTGEYLSSRMVDGGLLLTYIYSFRMKDVDFDDPATFVPQYGTLENMQCIPGSNIVCPDDTSVGRYTVVCKLDGESLEVEDSVALLGYNQEIYVSADTIYATRSYVEKMPAAAANQYRQTTMTEITGIRYDADSLEVIGTIAVEGAVKDQYSMDQFDGVLRVVTSTTISYVTDSVLYASSSISLSQRERNVNLYCIDLSNWQVAAEVIGFAPDGEDAQSVRFDGTNAYVCTAEVITFKDPVYFFDLSDLRNITWTDTGTIDGYSTSLIQFGGDYLVGIGFGDRRFLKIEAYAQEGDQVIALAAYEQKAWYSSAYKSYFIDRQRQLIGLAMLDAESRESRYVLLHFDGYAFHEICVRQIEMNNYSFVRAFMADGWLYVLTDHYSGIYTQRIS